MSLAEQILAIIRQADGLKTSEIIQSLRACSNDVNHVLYNELPNEIYQDNHYRWRTRDTQISDNNKSNAVVKKEPLFNLCTYYRECISGDMSHDISHFAWSKFEADYLEINLIPKNSESVLSIFSNPDSKNLLTKTINDSAKSLYFGCPILVYELRSKKGHFYKMVEPLFVFQTEINSLEYGGLPEFDLNQPQLNMKAMEHLLGTRGSSIQSEIFSLIEQLGLNNSPEDLPNLDELCLRLFNLCPQWSWEENIDLENLGGDVPLKSADVGIYNRAIIGITDRSPFTIGLEKELDSLAKQNDHKLSQSALLPFIKKSESDSSSKSEGNLFLEVLPLNEEQKQAVTTALSQDLTVITGPPGTGKSQVVTALIVNAIWQGKRVLFTSKNNKAVDVVEHRVNGLGCNPLLMRAGRKEYRARLLEYINRLISSVVSEEDSLDFNMLENAYSSKLHLKQILIDETEQVIALQNLITSLDQKTDSIRKLFSPEQIDYFRWSIPDGDFLLKLKNLISECDRKNNKKLVQIFWHFCASKKHKKLIRFTEKNHLVFDKLGVRYPNFERQRFIDDQLQNFYTQVAKQYEMADLIKEYFKKVDDLSLLKRLENIEKNIQTIEADLQATGLQLWQRWLTLMPTRWPSNSINLLQDFSSILQLIANSENANKEIPAPLIKKYERIFPQIMELFPCWAVTSLSARGSKIPFDSGFFDLVIIDEASQCDIASALPLLYRAKQAVIIGDPMQLKHISGLTKTKDLQLFERYNLLESNLAYMYSTNSLYDLAARRARPENVVRLRDHHRCHADIVQFSNEYFYGGSLRVATRYKKLNMLDSSTSKPAVRWVNVSGKVFRPNAGGAINTQEAKRIVSGVTDLIFNKKYDGSIGIVSPFRGQVNEVKKLLSQVPDLKNKITDETILVDTVHRFQGDERDLIIFSPVLAEGMPTSTIKFLNANGNLFNVAITRARSTLLVVGDLDAALDSDVSYLSAFAKYTKALAEKNQSTKLQTGYEDLKDVPMFSEWERWFYEKLKERGVDAIPQYKEEKYYLDLALFDGDRKLDIEIDGARYHKGRNGESLYRDRLRNKQLNELGWDVLRFWVYEIRDDTDRCIQAVLNWKNL